MKIQLIRDVEIQATFEWKDKWVLSTKNDSIRNWWENLNAAQSFFDGLELIFAWESIGYDVLVVDWTGWEKYKDEFERLEGSEKAIIKDYHKIIKHFTTKIVHKSKIYIQSPEEAPEGAKIQRGPRGGIYYEEEQAMPRHPLQGSSLAIKPLISLPLELGHIPEVTSFYAKYSSAKTAFDQLMACYDAWEWFKKNKDKLSGEQQKLFNRMHAKLNRPIRQILINEINQSEKKINYAKKYHFYPEAFKCVEEDLPFVSEILLKGLPINKFVKISDDKYKVTLGLNNYIYKDYFKYFANKDIKDFKLYREPKYPDDPNTEVKPGDWRYPEDIHHYVDTGDFPLGIVKIVLNTSEGEYILARESAKSSNINVIYNTTKAQLKKIQEKYFKFNIDVPTFVDDINKQFNEAEIGSNKEAESWAASWLMDTSGYSGTFSRIVIGLKNHFSLLESIAVGFRDSEPSPAHSLDILSNWSSGYSENKEKWLSNLQKDFAGLKKLHQDTQSFLETDKKYKKKDTITIYRGIGEHTNHRIFDSKFENENEVWVPPISSWTESPKIAKAFAESANGNVLVAEVPKSWVVAHWKCSPGYQQGGFYNPVTKQYRLKTQKEITIMSPENKIKCSKIMHWREMEE